MKLEAKEAYITSNPEKEGYDQIVEKKNDIATVSVRPGHLSFCVLRLCRRCFYDESSTIDNDINYHHGLQALLSLPVDGTEYNSIGDLLSNLHDWAVMLSFTFRTQRQRRNESRASWMCAFAEELNCTRRVRIGPDYANLGASEGPESWTLINDDGVHTCASRGEMNSASATNYKWLDARVSRQWQC